MSRCIQLGTHLHKPVKNFGTMALYFVNDIAVIVMDNGENRLNKKFVLEFDELLDYVESNSSCHGLITTSEGKFYGNGLDVDWLNGISAEETGDFFLKFSKLLMRLLLFPLPSLAAINGHAFAGGALFAITHDLRVQRHDKGWLCFNEVLINEQFIQFHIPLMRAKIGPGQIYTDAIILGKRYTGSEALDCGLVHAAPSMSLLLSESIQLLKSFSGKSGYPRKSLHLMKSDVYRDVVSQYQKDLSNDHIKERWCRSPNNKKAKL
ncbi:enoyl-CoA delta isomerase 3-like [Elysia marginata]|uniref:Enoyl-CoA delta isomerase 3-like n=1 Tax=Elysia marginata TaxID=1093978 RepID=A0AAV4JN44_9GAST|nr:enoyl-CoA delta isomerase 3-like [Elysia marginata]